MSKTHFTILAAKNSILNGEYLNADILHILNKEKPRLVPVTSLRHVLNDGEHQWNDTDDEDFNPDALINKWDEPLYQKHKERVENADLKYPLIIWNDTDPKGGYKVVDGVHRLTKAVREGIEQVLVKEITNEHFLMLAKQKPAQKKTTKKPKNKKT